MLGSIETMISQDLINKSINYYKKFKDEKYVVRPSLPILYFGDLDRYFQSDRRVLTVGKNPSDNEFRLTKDDKFSFVRFQKWKPTEENLIETLNSYFKILPLRKWFSSFEPILNGMDCSYYGKASNVALHTDICSPIATFPTWSNLTKTEQERLYTEGFQIWLLLLEELQPDYLLISIPAALFKSVIRSSGVPLLSFNQKKDGTTRKKPYEVTLHHFHLKSGKQVNVVFGQAANKPFDTITNDQKHKIGEKILNTD